jgi:hypothetical protein
MHVLARARRSRLGCRATAGRPAAAAGLHQALAKHQSAQTTGLGGWRWALPPKTQGPRAKGGGAPRFFEVVLFLPSLPYSLLHAVPRSKRAPPGLLLLLLQKAHSYCIGPKNNRAPVTWDSIFHYYAAPPESRSMAAPPASLAEPRFTFRLAALLSAVGKR